MPATPAHLLGLLPADLVAHMEAAGERCSLTEARQVLSRVISEGSPDPTPRREPRRALVEAIRRQATWERLEVLERVTAAAFGQRRKMLRASLRSLLPEPEVLLNELSINPELRAEQLPVEAFARLAAKVGG